MVKNKPSRSPEVNESKNSTEKNKGQESNTKRHRGKNTRTKTQGPELESETEFKGWSSDLEGYILYLGPRYLEKFPRKINKLERYHGSTYIDSCKQAITNNTPTNPPDPEMPTIIPETGDERPKTETDII